MLRKFVVDTRDSLVKKPYLLCVLITTLIFVLLFYKYIFQDYVYVFTLNPDIGSDTANTYYPIYLQLSRIIHGEVPWSSFNIQFGFGANVLPNYLSLMNPIDLIAVIFPPSLLDKGLLFATYCKFIIITIFSYFYFKVLFQSKKTICISVILWTFSSYSMVWGNHYQFLTCMTYFTIFMTFFQNMLIDKARYEKYFVITIAFFTATSYYFIYMTGIFSVLYLCFYGILHKWSLIKVIKKCLRLGLLALLGIGISMVILLPILIAFFNSARTLGANNILAFMKVYDSNTLYAFLTRFLSPSLLGGPYSPEWSGVSNFYEIAELSTSMLIMPALVYVLVYSPKKKIYRIITIIAIIALSLQITSQLLLFNYSTQRWSYYIVFLEILVIANFLEFVFVSNHNRLINKSLKYGLLLFIALVAVVVLKRNEFIGVLDKRVLLTVVIVGSSYIVLLYLFKKNKSQLFKGLLVVVSIEIITSFWPIYTNRGVQTRDEFYSTGYYDGTEKAVQYLKEKDPSVYRISKSYISKSHNDSQVQQYSSFISYSSINSKYLYDFLSLNHISAYQGTYLERHVMELASYNSVFKAFLGEKYLLSTNVIDSDQYKYLTTISGINIYENINFSSFGTILQNQVSPEILSYNSSSILESVLPKAYYQNGENIDLENIFTIYDFENSLLNEGQMINIEASISDNKITLNGTGDDMQIIIDAEKINSISGQSTIYLDLAFSSSEASSIQIFSDNGDGYTEENSLLIDYNMNDNHLTIPISTHNLKSIRIDPSLTQQNILVKKAKLLKLDESKLNTMGTNASVITNYFEDEFQVTASSDEAGMMVLPIIYDEQWKLYVDQQETPLEKVDNGLIGVKISSGNHEITLKFQPAGLIPGLVVTILSLFIFLVYIVYHKKNISNSLIEGKEND